VILSIFVVNFVIFFNFCEFLCCLSFSVIVAIFVMV